MMRSEIGSNDLLLNNNLIETDVEFYRKIFRKKTKDIYSFALKAQVTYLEAMWKKQVVILFQGAAWLVHLECLYVKDG